MMKTEIETRERLKAIESANRNMEDIAAFVNASGVPESRLYVESLAVENFLKNWLLAESPANENQKKTDAP